MSRTRIMVTALWSGALWVETLHVREEVRRMALVALGKLGDPAAAPTLEKALEDEHHSVRCAAALALAEVNRPETPAKLLAVVDRHGCHPLNEAVVTALVRAGPSPRKELTAAIKHENPEVRTVAMRVLALSADGELLPTFVAGLADSERFVRFAAAQGLANIRKSPQAVEALLEATRHEDPKDRRLADLAWRSLWIRQDNGTFSEVMEAENEVAVRARPAWLDTKHSTAQRLMQ